VLFVGGQGAGYRAWLVLTVDQAGALVAGSITREREVALPV
jgi:hypothetical protein